MGSPRRMKRFERKKPAKKSNYSESRGLADIAGKGQIDNERDIEENVFAQLQDDELVKRRKEEALKMAVNRVQEFKREHKRLPKREEYEDISTSIFEQLKAEDDKKKMREREERNRKSKEERTKGGRKGKQEEQIPQEQSIQNPVLSEVKDLEIKDILSEGGEQGEGSEEFNLSGLDTGEEKKTCPSCKKETEEVIFCPECGNAFCAQCAKTQAIAGQKKIYCPKCAKEIKR
jgi:hypothetical protein